MGLWVVLRRSVALLLLAVMACSTAQAREIPVQTCIAKILRHAATTAGEQRTPFDCGSRQTRFGAGDFAVELRFAPISPTADDPLVLRTASQWQDAERIRFRYADGSAAILNVTSHSIAPFLKMGAIFEFPVPVRGSALTGIELEIRGAGNLRGVVLGAHLRPRSEASRINTTLAALYAMFAGLTVALFVFNLSLWAALRAQFQLFYCSMVAALANYAFTSSGAVMMVLPWLDNNDRQRWNYICLAIAGGTALRFIARYFGPEVRGPHLFVLHRAGALTAVTTALAFGLFAPWHIAFFDRIYYIAMSFMLSTVFPLLIQAWRKGSPYFNLFILAWAAPIAISVLRAMYGFGLLPYSILLDNGNLVAMSIEALLSSLMVTARLRDLARERDNARAGEQTARRLAATDPLTGLLNRRAFLDLAIGHRARKRLLLIDIDHFKAVNERLGHEGGDQVLAAVAAAIQQIRPPNSLAVRLGGEEFALLIPRELGDQCTAQMVLEAVRATHMPQGLQVTVSIGVSDGQLASEEDWKRLYRLADAALYRAKADGRDRACRATDFRAAA